jgi:hypothetical protein
MKWLAIPLVVLFGAQVATIAQASTITTSVSTPSGIISSPTTDGSFEQLKKTGTGGNWIELGQTFTVTSDFTLDTISLLINQDVSLLDAGLNLEVTLFEAATVAATSGTALAGYPDQGTTIAFTKGTNLWMTFDVANVALTTSGPTSGIYGFKVGFFGANSANNQLGLTDPGLNGVAHDGDVFAGGQMFRLRPPPTASSGYADNDLSFVIQAVPEPSAFALVSIAVLGLTGYGLRRRAG